MSKPKTIKLLEGAFQTTNIAIKDDVVLTKLKLTSKFDQLVADALEIKSSIYNTDGQRRPGLRKLELDLLLFGATIHIAPTQANLFDNAALQLDSIQISDAWVRRLRADEALRLSFTITMAGIPRQLLDYIEGVRKNTINITIEEAPEVRKKSAMAQATEFGLFKQEKDGEEDDDDDSGDEDEENDDAAVAALKPGPDEPQELTGSALASWREVNGNKSRRQGKAKGAAKP